MTSVLEPLFIFGPARCHPAWYYSPGKCLVYGCLPSDARLPKWRKHLSLTTLDSGDSWLSPRLKFTPHGRKLCLCPGEPRPELLVLKLAQGRVFPKCEGLLRKFALKGTTCGSMSESWCFYQNHQ